MESLNFQFLSQDAYEKAIQRYLFHVFSRSSPYLLGCQKGLKNEMILFCTPCSVAVCFLVFFLNISTFIINLSDNNTSTKIQYLSQLLGALFLASSRRCSSSNITTLITPLRPQTFVADHSLL